MLLRNAALDSRKHKLSLRESKEEKLSLRALRPLVQLLLPLSGEKTAGYRVLPIPDSTSPQNLLSKSRKKCG